MKIKYKLFVSLASLSFIIFYMFMATVFVTNLQKDDLLVINLAGRQRMLTQKMTKEIIYFQVSRNENNSGDPVLATTVRNTMKVFDQTLYALKNSGKAPLSLDLKTTKFRECPEAEEPVLSQMVIIERLWVDFFKNMKSLLKDNTDSAQKMKLIKNNNIPLLKAMNKGVVMMQAQSEEKVKILKIALGFGIIIGIIIMILAFISVSRVLKRIERIRDSAQVFSSGDLTKTFVDIYDPSQTVSLDEIGELTQSLNAFIHKLQDVLKVINSNADDLSSFSLSLTDISSQMSSAADKTSTRSEQVAASSEQVAASVDTVAAAAEESSISVANISEMTETMSASVNSVSRSIQKTAVDAKTSAQVAENMSSSITTIALTIDELTISLNEVASNTAMASRISTEANHRTEQINGKIGSLVTASNQIGKVINVIKDIADQTNMLALNATIEASGAGDAGKGFAVVAGEVKELAKQSAEATEKITEQIDQIQSSTGEAVESIEEINKVISEIAHINETIATAVEEQTATAAEISKTVASNAEDVKAVASNAEESARRIGDMDKSTDEVSNAAIEVARFVDELSAGVGEVARSSGEAALGVRKISENIQGIFSGAQETSTRANRSSELSNDLSKMSSVLSQIVNQFKV